MLNVFINMELNEDLNFIPQFVKTDVTSIKVVQNVTFVGIG